MSNMRQKIAEHMVFSKRTSAHVTTVHKVDMTRIAKMRDRVKGEFQARYGFSLTFLPFVMRAATAALQAFPLLNSSIDGTNIIYHRDINLGIAVALENGLIVPVIRNADEKNVVGLQRSIVDLASRARSRQLRPDEVQAGTFSITNFGSFGSVFATPVINQPQVAILGVGTVEKVPVVVDDAIAIRSMCYLALTFDHRLIDGALGDQFTQKVKIDPGKLERRSSVARVLASYCFLAGAAAGGAAAGFGAGAGAGAAAAGLDAASRTSRRWCRREHRLVVQIDHFLGDVHRVRSVQHRRVLIAHIQHNREAILLSNLSITAIIFCPRTFTTFCCSCSSSACASSSCRL